MDKKLQQRVLCVLASIALAFTYVAIGFAICAGFPQITRVASLGNSAFDASPYAHDSLVNLAEQTRNYTVEDAGEEGAHERYAQQVLSAAAASMDDPTRSASWTDEARSVVAGWNDGSISAAEAMDALASTDESYALSTEALSHLEDVHEVIAQVRMPLLGCTLIAAFCLMSLVWMFGARPAGRALLAGGCITLGAFVLLGAWGLFGFDALFAWMHSLFFADGTWTFPADSLLIEMYPEGFWMTIGLWWLGSSCVVAAASIIIGLVILKRKAQPAEEPRQPAGLQA